MVPQNSSPSLDQGRSGNRHILIAEDDEVLAELLQLVLAGENFTVAIAKDSDEAMAAVKAKPPALILMDIMIPGLSGFDLLRELKANQFYRDIPVIMLSSRAGERDQVQAFDFGAADFISKPFRIEDLAVRIKRVLVRHQIEEA